MKKIALAVLAVCALSFTGCAKKTVVVINSAEDLNGKTIGCQAGTTGELYVQDEVENAKLKSFKTGVDAALGLKNGAVDAVVLDELPAREIVKRNSSLKIVETPFVKEDYAIAVRKGDTELLNSINNTIATIRQNGTYENLISSFIMTIDGTIKVPAAFESEGTEVIRMGTNAAFPPFEYYDNTKIVGFDVSLSQIIARDLGKKLKVVDMDFDGLIAALQSGAIDFVAAGMTANDERRQNVDFSEPYYSSNQVIIVRK